MGPIVIRIKRRWIITIKNFFMRNPGAASIIGFQVSLIVCTGMLIFNNSILADGVANLAYFLLVIGVVVQLVTYVLEKKEN